MTAKIVWQGMTDKESTTYIERAIYNFSINVMVASYLSCHKYVTENKETIGKVCFKSLIRLWEAMVYKSKERSEWKT